MSALFFMLLTGKLFAQQYYQNAWNASNIHVYPATAVEDGQEWLLLGRESVYGDCAFLVFDNDLQTLLRGYYLVGSSYGNNFYPYGMVLINDTVYIAGTGYGNDATAILIKMTKGAAGQNPQILQSKYFTSSLCSLCNYESEFTDIKFRNDTLFVLGTINDNGNKNVFLLMLNKNLDTLKTVKYAYPGTNTSDYGMKLHLGNNGNIFITGTTYGLSSYGDLIIMKLNSQGNLIWSKIYGYENYEYGRNIYEDIFGNLYVLGYSSQGAASMPEAMIMAKLNSSGNIQWHQYIDWPHNSDEIHAKNWYFDNNDIYIGAVTYTTAINQMERPYIVKMNTNGNVSYVKEFAWSNYEVKGYPFIAKINGNSLLMFTDQSASPSGLVTISTSKYDSVFCSDENIIYNFTTGQGQLTDTFYAFDVLNGNVDVVTDNSLFQIQPASLSKNSLCDTCTLPYPSADFSYSVNGLTVTFNNLSQNSNSWTWDFGDGNTSTQQNPTHTYASYGDYTVCLYAHNDCYTDYICQTVSVLQDTSVNIDNNIDNTHQALVYWNANTNQLILKNVPSNALMEIYSIDGKRINVMVINAENTGVNLSGSKGIYYLRILDTRNQSVIYQNKLLIFEH